MKVTEPTLMLLTATPSVAVTPEATLQTETNLELDEDLQNHVRVYDARQSAVPGEHHGLHLEQTQFTSRQNCDPKGEVEGVDVLDVTSKILH